MASSSMIMLSNVSMERLYLSQPPAWNDLQRLSYSLTQSQQQQSQQDTRLNQQLFRTCYDKLLHHMYDINSSSSLTTSTASVTTINQINEQLELAAEYCQLKTYRDGNTVYLHSDQFHLEVRFDSQTHLPISIASCFINEEPLICTNMLKALNEKQYKLFREHLNGYAQLFTLVAPNLNDDKRIGYMTYKILQQDLERLSKIDSYRKLFEGFQPMFEGLPMNIKLGDDDSVSLRILIVPSNNNQYYLPIKSSLFMDDKTNTIQIDSSIKSSTLATGYFALEFDENQPAFICLQTFAQEISRLTNIQTFLSSTETKTFNYLSTILPKTKTFHQYHWYISHDQLAISIRQIPFTNIKQLIQILNLIRQQMYLTKYFNYYFNQLFDDREQMDDEHNEDILLELSLLSSTMLSITCAQAQYLSTFVMKMSDIDNLPILIHRSGQKEYELTDETNSLFKLIEKLLQQAPQPSSSPPQKIEQPTRTSPVETAAAAVPPPPPQKLNRRLSCVPPAKPTWRRATTLRRNQPACLTLGSTSREKSVDESVVDDEMTQNISTDDYHGNNDENNPDDDDLFIQFTEQQLQNQQSYHPQFSSRPLLSFRPSTLSRCTSVSSTQSVSTPPIFGLSPSTPYPGGSNNPNGNIFFPLGKQVSVPEYSPVSSPMTLGTLDPSAFLPASSLPQPANNDPNNKNPQQKKKRRRSEHSADDFIQTLNSDNRSSIQTTKLNTSGNNGGNDPSNIKRGKKPMDKNPQQLQQQQLVRQKSAFKVTDSPTATLLSQQSVTSPDDSSNDLKPLKVVIKRVEGGGNSSNDESQQQVIKQRKKQQQQAQQQQQQMGNNGGSMQGQMRKLSTNNSLSNSSPSVVVKSESIDIPQLNTDPNNMMSSNDGTQQQQPRERPRPSSSLANPSSSLSASNTSQPRSAPPQPPIVLKIQRSKVYPGQDQTTTSSSSSSNPTAVATQNTSQASNNIPSALKEALKHRVRSMPSGANTPKSQVTSPPILAAKLTSPSTGTSTNPLAQANPVSTLFRIPKKSSSQDITVKPKIEPGTVPLNTNNNTSPSMSKTPLIPGPGVRPSLPAAQVGSWQSPPTQQPSRFNQNRPRPSWPQQQVQRGRSPVTPPNVPNLNAGHSSMNNFSQPPRSILKKPPSNEGSGSDLLYMPSDMSAFNDSRMNANFTGVSQNRTTTPTDMYDDNDDDTSPQAQLVIDTSSNPTNNVHLPYSMVSGSNASTGMDNYDPMHDNNSMMNSSQQQMVDDSFPNLD